MSSGYGREGLRQVCAMLLGERHVPECLCGGLDYLGCYNKCLTFAFFAFFVTETFACVKQSVDSSVVFIVKLQEH